MVVVITLPQCFVELAIIEKVRDLVVIVEDGSRPRKLEELGVVKFHGNCHQYSECRSEQFNKHS